MKEVQFYYSASATLLQDLVLQKYSDVFAKHNVSIDNLPLLDDASLFEVKQSMSFHWHSFIFMHQTFQRWASQPRPTGTQSWQQ